MKKTRLFPILAILLTSAMLLTGCTKEETKGENSSTTSQNTAQQDNWVDLDLPSGLLWYSCNVGASKPEEFGDYFAWGETRPKNVYDWETYAYGIDWDELSKYCTKGNFGHYGFTDGLTTLQASNDAATAALGNGARTPTTDEWRELIDNCTSTWTTKNGVYGNLFTGHNGNTIFLPAAGYRRGSNLFDAGSYGFYWSNSILTDYPYDAWYFYFFSVYANLNYYYYRILGFSIRPVRSAH